DSFSVEVLPPRLAIDLVKDGPALSKIGDPVTYTYAVTNSGEAPLSNVVVSDDAGTPGTPGDDFTADPVLANGFNVGDGNQNRILDVGETWQFTKTITVPTGATDPFVNTATVTASSTLTDSTVNNTDTHSV